MSIELMSKAITSHVGDTISKFILIMLSGRADEDDNCPIPYDEIEKICELKIDDVRDYVTHLRHSGFLTRLDKDDNQGRVLYHIVIGKVK